VEKISKTENWKNAFPKENRYFETNNGILYCADCIDILRQIPENSVDLVLTDPPYGVNSNERNGIDYKDNFYNVDAVSKELFRTLKDNTRTFIFTAQKTFLNVVEYFTSNSFNLHQTLIWLHPNLTGGTKKKVYDFTSVYEQIILFHKGKPRKLKKAEGFFNFDVLKYPQPQSNFKKDKRQHIHQKPVNLIEHLILVTTDENDLVLDPFLGSGTTAVVCEKLNRRWIGIEINSNYCEMAKERLLYPTRQNPKMKILI